MLFFCGTLMFVICCKQKAGICSKIVLSIIMKLSLKAQVDPGYFSTQTIEVFPSLLKDAKSRYALGCYMRGLFLSWLYRIVLRTMYKKAVVMSSTVERGDL